MVLDVGGSSMQQATRDPSCRQKVLVPFPGYGGLTRSREKMTNTHRKQPQLQRNSCLQLQVAKRCAKVKERQRERVRGKIDMDTSDCFQNLVRKHISDRRAHRTYRQRGDESDMETDQSA